MNNEIKQLFYKQQVSIYEKYTKRDICVCLNESFFHSRVNLWRMMSILLCFLLLSHVTMTIVIWFFIYFKYKEKKIEEEFQC